MDTVHHDRHLLTTVLNPDQLAWLHGHSQGMTYAFTINKRHLGKGISGQTSQNRHLWTDISVRTSQSEHLETNIFGNAQTLAKRLTGSACLCFLRCSRTRSSITLCPWLNRTVPINAYGSLPPPSQCMATRSASSNLCQNRWPILTPLPIGLSIRQTYNCCSSTAPDSRRACNPPLPMAQTKTNLCPRPQKLAPA